MGLLRRPLSLLPLHQSQPQAPPGASPQNTSPPVQPTEGPVTLTAELEQKLRSELALVKGNLTVMSEMLNELVPGQSQPDDTELLQQLYSVCKNMQTRVVELIPQLLDEGFIEELLVVNDDLNNAFIRYERFDRLNKAQITNTQQQSSTNSPNFIDLSPGPSTLGQPAVITTTSQPTVSTWANQRQSANHKEEEEFDMFAQTRGSSLAEQRKSVRYEDPGAVEGLAGALDTRLQVTGGMPPTKNSLQNDIDKWLSCDMEEQSSVSEGVSSDDFDKFLEDRAKAADHSSQGTCSMPPSTSRPPPQSTRQQDSSHDQLFSL
uniref:GAT domain-containing protein n=1 Tax=Lates calcarifer TaxID=8187 RepID=A0A4W6F7M3_LATCA